MQRGYHKKAVEAGFVKGLFAKEVGGTDVPAHDFAIAAEELTAVDVNVPNTLLGAGLRVNVRRTMDVSEAPCDASCPQPCLG